MRSKPRHLKKIIIGLIFHQMRNYDKAFACFNRARELNPMDLNVLKGLGRTCFELLDYSAAIDYYTQCLEFGGPSSVTFMSE